MASFPDDVINGAGRSVAAYARTSCLQMAAKLPAEILQLIVDCARTRKQGNAFNPVPHDNACIQGFAKASREFAQIVASLPEDRIFLHALGPAQIKLLKERSSGTAWFALGFWWLHLTNRHSLQGMSKSTLASMLTRRNFSRYCQDSHS